MCLGAATERLGRPDLVPGTSQSTYAESVGKSRISSNLSLVLELFKQLYPPKSLPNFPVHSGQGNWKRCLLTTQMI